MSVNQSIKPISIEYADNIKIGGCDLIDLAKKYTKIIYKDTTIYFNQDEIRQLENVNITKGIPVAYSKSKGILYYTGEGQTISEYITGLLMEEFADVYKTTKAG